MRAALSSTLGLLALAALPEGKFSGALICSDTSACRVARLTPPTLLLTHEGAFSLPSPAAVLTPPPRRPIDRPTMATATPWAPYVFAAARRRFVFRALVLVVAERRRLT